MRKRVSFSELASQAPSSSVPAEQLAPAGRIRCSLCHRRTAVLIRLLRLCPGVRSRRRGAVAALIVSAVGLLFLLYTGSAPQLSGAYGEDNTHDVLRRAKRHRHVWGWIDHLVLTPVRVLAIDSKWHAVRVDDTVLHKDAAAARAAARHAGLILRSLRHQDLQIHPLVVLWGQSQHDLQGPTRTIDGVEIISGRELRQWLRQRPTGTVTKERAEQVLSALGEFKVRVNPSRRADGV
jgi:hypothetical protein